MGDGKAEYLKFVRFFTSRLIQTLVQARLGEKLDQKCSSEPDQVDWFNTKVDELGEIAAYLRSTVNRYPPICPSIALEFLLYTADGQYLPLESWKVSVEDDADRDVNVRTQLYHQLGTLLRSAALAARVTPMYRYYVKKQSPSTFVILYRIYEGGPLADLGEESVQRRIGCLPSPYGTLCVDLEFRTKMEIAPRPIAIQSMIAERPSHLVLPPSSSQPRLPCRPSFSDAVPVTGGEACLTTPMTDTMCVFTTSPQQHSVSPTYSSGPPKFRLGRSSSSEESTLDSQSTSFDRSKESQHSNRSLPKLRSNNSFPFAALLTSATKVKRGSVSSANDILFEEPENVPSKEETLECEVRRSKSDDCVIENERDDDRRSSDDSYEKICDFSDEPANDLGQFIKDVRSAPVTMLGFVPESPNALSDQLANFEENARQFDTFLETLRLSHSDQ